MGALLLGAGIAAQDGADLDGVHDATGEGLAFAEVTTSRAVYFVQEPIVVRLRFGFAAEFVRDRMVQPFRQPLDVPAQLHAPWLDGLPGADLRIAAIPASTAEATLASVAVNDRRSAAVRVADEVRGGATFRVLELERTFLAQHPGELVLTAPLLRFAYGTRFREDVFRGRVPEDRRDAVVRGAALVLRVEALPEDERPLDFSGAVGSFTVQAAIDVDTVRMGDDFNLALRIEGEGNLHGFDAPVLAVVDGFRVTGTTDEKAVGARLFTVGLTPTRAGVREVPPLPFVFFDPTPPGRYRTVHTSPLPIEVRARPVPGKDDIFGLKSVDDARDAAPPYRPSAGLVLVVLLAPWLLVAGLLGLRRRRHHHHPRRRAVREAAASFHARAKQDGADEAENLTAFLAALLDCPGPAVVGRDLAARLVATGAEADLARRAAAILDALHAGRYGGAVPRDIEGTCAGLVDELARALLGAEGPG